MKKFSFSKAALAAFLTLIPLVMSGVGCNSDNPADTTQVRLNITRSADRSDGAIGRPMVDPSLHPMVGVIVWVFAPDLPAPITYVFTPEEVAAKAGVITLDVPTGQARTFYARAVDLDPAPSPDVFPASLYATNDAPANRTFDLTGVTVILNLSLTQSATHSMTGTINDARLGVFNPLQPCALPSVGMTFSLVSMPEFALPITSISVDPSGMYTLNNVPDDEEIIFGVGDMATGAIASGLVAANTSALDWDLIGAGPLSINPTSQTVASGTNIQFTSSGGAGGQVFGPYMGGAMAFLPAGSISSAMIFTTPSGGTISDTGFYVSGPFSDMIDDIQVTDGCFLDEFSTPESIAVASILVSMSAQCTDNIDNDGDTVTDFPADPGCAGTLDSSELGMNECDDGSDNDGDTAIDYPDDAQCTSPADLTEWTSSIWACSDLTDNDGDTLADFPTDPGCWGVTDTSELGTAQCDDGIDNDTDTFIDMADADCTDPADTIEGTAPGSIFGIVYDWSSLMLGANVYAEPIAGPPGYNIVTLNDGTFTLNGLPPGNYILQITQTGYVGEYYNTKPSYGTANIISVSAGMVSNVGNITLDRTDCNDGLDNDGDTSSDFPTDTGCASIDDTSERNVIAGCDDGLDNDGDTKIDYPADSGCAMGIADLTEYAMSTGSCDNGSDEDGDTLIDYADPACKIAGASGEDSTLTGLQCDDGIDNDSNTFIDFPLDTFCVTPTQRLEGPGSLTGTACDDGQDNDSDGYYDFPADSGCSSAADTSEFGSNVCDNGTDNDSDGFIDFPFDMGCASLGDFTETISIIMGGKECEDGIDNDADGLYDYRWTWGADAQPGIGGVDDNGNGKVDDGFEVGWPGSDDVFIGDPGCFSQLDNNERGSTQCDDGIDNDNDTFVDYNPLAPPGADATCTSAKCDDELFGIGCP